MQIKKKIKYDLYMEKCRWTMAKTKDKIIPNLAFILKDREDSNSKPYRDAIERLIRLGEWEKRFEGWALTSKAKTLYSGSEALRDSVSDEDILKAVKKGDTVGLSQKSGEFFANNPDKLKESVCGDLGKFLIETFISIRAERLGFEKVNAEVRDILAKIKPLKKQG